MEISKSKSVKREKITRKSYLGNIKKAFSEYHIVKCGSIVTMTPIHEKAAPKTRLPSRTLSYLINLPHTASDFIDKGHHMTPTRSPKETMASKWKEIHGSTNWETLLDPLHPWLRREILKYGEFAEATYDAFDFDSFSEYCGSCRFNKNKLFDKLCLTSHGYKVTKYVYAMANVDVPDWLERAYLGDSWSKDSNWIGYIAVSTEDESMRIGRRDIVVAWRGTVAPTEWLSDLKSRLRPMEYGIDKENVKVQQGFHGIYTAKGENTRYNKLSASEQSMQELTRLVNLYKGKGEEVSLTITGHSLGGALALLNAHEAATAFPDLFISVISFGAPRVGNIAFRDELTRLGVKVLRVVVKQDIVPRLPGIIFNEILHKFESITRKLKWVYRHVGVELKLNASLSPYLKSEFNLTGFHCLETYLHLLDGFTSSKAKFRWNARRDIALVNKSSEMLIDELRIPANWYQLPYKGLVFNSYYGRWVKPKREPEDIPYPSSEPSSPD